MIFVFYDELLKGICLFYDGMVSCDAAASLFLLVDIGAPGAPGGGCDGYGSGYFLDISTLRLQSDRWPNMQRLSS